jgi:CspA family cold shock protein
VSGPEKLKVDKFGLSVYISVVDIACLTFVIARWQRALDELPSSKSRSSSVVLPHVRSSIAMKGFVMTTGTVKWFNSTKGFGFIQPDDGGADAFVHISAVERAGMREIVEGQKIGYELERDNKSGKMSACNLQAA